MHSGYRIYNFSLLNTSTHKGVVQTRELGFSLQVNAIGRFVTVRDIQCNITLA